MGTGAEVRYLLKGITVRTFYHQDGDPGGIGQGFCIFLGTLSKSQWKTIELRLREEVTWYESSRQQNILTYLG
jgi:hypothetical protein